MANVIQFKRPVQVQNPEDFEDFDSAAQIHLLDNLNANLSYLSSKDKDELLLQLLAGFENISYADSMLQEKIDNRESKRERQAQRKHLRSLIDRMIQTDNTDPNAYNEFLDAIEDAYRDGLISKSARDNIACELYMLAENIDLFTIMIYCDDTDSERAQAFLDRILTAQAKLNRYVYYIAR